MKRVFTFLLVITALFSTTAFASFMSSDNKLEISLWGVQAQSNGTYTVEMTIVDEEGNSYRLSVPIEGLSTKEKTAIPPIVNATPKPSYKAKTTFTNAYGTPTTRCAHVGCNNYIASSGNTNCCSTHSRRCLECNQYCDEDGLYCLTCIIKAFK